MMCKAVLLYPYAFSTGETAQHSSRLCFPGLILPDSLRFGNAAKLQNLVPIIGENMRYSEPFVADFERGCQGGGSYKDPLYEAEGGLAYTCAEIGVIPLIQSFFICQQNNRSKEP